MANNEKIVLSVETRGTAKSVAELAAVSGAVKALSGEQSDFEAATNRLNASQRKLNSILPQTSGQMGAFGKVLNKINQRYSSSNSSILDFIKSLGSQKRAMRALFNEMQDYDQAIKLLTQRLNTSNKSLKMFTRVARYAFFALIALGIEFAVVALSLASINAAFAVGNAIIKLYRVSMASLAYAAAGVGVALTTAAAAQREYTAAQFAHVYKATPMFGSAMNHSMAALRNLTSDTSLAIFGIQQLTAAFGAVSKYSAFTPQSQQALRALADFASIGGDPGKNLVAIGNFIGLLQKEGKVTYKVSEAARAVGEEFDKAFKTINKGGGSAASVFAAISSGQMSKSAGITGAADLVNQTLFGMFKTYKTLIISLFSDVGTVFLEPAKRALDDIFSILKNGMFRLTPLLTAFGQGGFFPMLVSATNKLTNLFVMLMNKYLPQSEGLMTRLQNGYQEIVRTFRVLVENLNRLRDGGSVIIRMFGKPIREFFSSIGENVEHLSQLAVDNEKLFMEFGERLKGVVDAFFDFAAKFKEVFTEALPILNQIVHAVELMIRGFTKLFGFIGSTTTGAALMMGLAGVGFAKGTRGGQIRSYYDAKGNPKGFASKLFGGGIGMGAQIGGAITGTPFFAGKGLRPAGAVGTIIPGVNDVATLAKYEAFDRLNNNKYLQKIMSRNFQPTKTGKILANIYAKLGVAPDMAGKAAVDAARQAAEASGKTLSRGAATGTYLKGRSSIAGGLQNIALSYLAAQSFMPNVIKQNQGAVQAGIFAGGLYGPAGGIVGGGMGLLNLQRGKGARTTQGGILTGALSGAALGAGLGTILGGPLIGTAIGAVLGAAFGYFKGKEFEQKVAKEAGKSVSGFKLAQITDALIGGDTTKARGIIGAFQKEAESFTTMSQGGRQSLLGRYRDMGLISSTQMERALRHAGDYNKVIQDNANALQKLNPLFDNFDYLMNGLASTTGLNREELIKLAHQRNVDLLSYDKTTGKAMDLATAIQKLGLQMDLTAEGLAAAGRDAVLKAGRVFDEFRQRQQLRQAVDQSQKAVERGGTKEGFADYAQNLMAYLTTKYPNNPAMALNRFATLVSAPGTVGSVFNPLGPLGGQYGQYTQTGGAGLVGDFQKEAARNLAEQRAAALGQRLLTRGLEFTQGTVSTQQLVAGLSSAYLDPTKQKQVLAIEQAITSGIGLGYDTNSIINLLNTIMPSGGGFSLSGTLQASKAGGEIIELSEKANQLSIQLREQISNAIAVGFDDKPIWWESNPEWWTKESIKKLLESGDTSSPRGGGIGDTLTSRLGRTMSRHNYLDSQLTGSRTITSAYRTTNLGSINSDHVTGRAYDLVGQNLGQYSTLVKQMGGFAEFHGVAGNRHLHVVPGQTPFGDTGTNRTTTLSGAPRISPSSSGGSVVVNVYPREGQSEAQIAKYVMNEIAKSQRNSKERR